VRGDGLSVYVPIRSAECGENLSQLSCNGRHGDGRLSRGSWVLNQLIDAVRARDKEMLIHVRAPVAPTFAAAVCATWPREVFKLKGGPG